MPTMPRSKLRRMRASAWSLLELVLLHPVDAKSLLLLKRVERAHRLGDAADEVPLAVDGVLPPDEELGSEGEVVADEDPAPGTEAEGERLVDAVPDAHREGDPIGDGALEVERPEELGAVLHDSELFACYVVARPAEGVGDNVEDPAVGERIPPALGGRCLELPEVLHSDGLWPRGGGRGWNRPWGMLQQQSGGCGAPNLFRMRLKPP